VAQGSIIGNDTVPEANFETPLNGAKTAPKTTPDGSVPVVGGCVAANTATTCIRTAGPNGTGPAGIGPGGFGVTTVNGSSSYSYDPRLFNVGYTAQVRAVQCKNTAYANSAAASNDYSFTAYAHESFNFNGSPDATAPSAFDLANETMDSSAGTFLATWSATKVYLGINDATNLSAASVGVNRFVQFYFRSGGTFPANGLTETPDNSAGGSLIGWPSAAAGAQALETPVNYHLYFDTATVGGLGGGGGAVQAFHLRKWNGSAWTDITGGESASIQVLSGFAGYIVIAIDRAAFGLSTSNWSQAFVFFGDLADGGAAGTVIAEYPSGSTADPGTTSAGAPRQFTDKSNEPTTKTGGSYFRLHLNGYRAPNYSDDSEPGFQGSNLKPADDSFDDLDVTIPGAEVPVTP
jgi:hypothetical protein